MTATTGFEAAPLEQLRERLGLYLARFNQVGAELGHLVLDYEARGLRYRVNVSFLGSQVLMGVVNGRRQCPPPALELMEVNRVVSDLVGDRVLPLHGFRRQEGDHRPVYWLCYDRSALRRSMEA